MKRISNKDKNSKKIWLVTKFLVLIFGIVFSGIPNSVLALEGEKPGFRPGRMEVPEPPPATGEKKFELRIPEGGKAFGEELEKVKLVLNKVDIQGVTVFSEDELKVFYEDMLGQEISLSRVYEIEEKITQKYKQAGYVLSRALVPRQKVQDGIVQVLIVEGYIDQVSIEGADKMQNLVRSYLDKIVGKKPLNIQELERYLLLVNDLAGVTSQNILRPSDATQGASELVVVLERKPVDVFLSYDNYGSYYVGPERAALGVNLNSIIGKGEKVGVVGLMTNPSDELKYGMLSISAPFGSEGFSVNMSAAAGPSKPDDDLALVGTESKTEVYTASVKYPFIRRRNLNFSLEGGYSDLTYEVDALNSVIIDDDIPKFFSTASCDFLDGFAGANLISLTINQGMDWAGKQKGSLTASRVEADPEFTTFKGEVQRIQFLDYFMPGVSFVLKGLWQYSDAPLYSSEEFGLGGRVIGRGFDDGEIIGDRGVGFTTELQYLTQEYKGLKGQPYVFFDSGKVWNIDDADQNTTNEEPVLESTGVGVKVFWKEYVTLNAEVAKPLTHIPSREIDQDEHYYFGITFTY